jgi:hypothetical protein
MRCRERCPLIVEVLLGRDRVIGMTIAATAGSSLRISEKI